MKSLTNYIFELKSSTYRNAADKATKLGQFDRAKQFKDAAEKAKQIEKNLRNNIYTENAEEISKKLKDIVLNISENDKFYNNFDDEFVLNHYNILNGYKFLDCGMYEYTKQVRGNELIYPFYIISFNSDTYNIQTLKKLFNDELDEDPTELYEWIYDNLSKEEQKQYDDADGDLADFMPGEMIDDYKEQYIQYRIDTFTIDELEFPQDLMCCFIYSPDYDMLAAIEFDYKSNIVSLNQIKQLASEVIKNSKIGHEIFEGSVRVHDRVTANNLAKMCKIINPETKLTKNDFIA